MPASTQSQVHADDRMDAFRLLPPRAAAAVGMAPRRSRLLGGPQCSVQLRGRRVGSAGAHQPAWVHLRVRALVRTTRTSHRASCQSLSGPLSLRRSSRPTAGASSRSLEFGRRGSTPRWFPFPSGVCIMKCTNKALYNCMEVQGAAASRGRALARGWRRHARTRLARRARCGAAATERRPSPAGLRTVVALDGTAVCNRDADAFFGWCGHARRTPASGWRVAHARVRGVERLGPVLSV